MTEGKPYTNTIKRGDEGIYGTRPSRKGKTCVIENKGERYPLSIQKFNNSNNNTKHHTQKPVEACEWLIKSYSNEGDTVLDFTMGSGSTGVACKNTNRKFIGIELNEEIFKVAEERINLDII